MGKQHILVVDDEELNRMMLEDSLCDEYEVDLACNGAEALELIEKDPFRYAAVLSDLSMPTMDGFGLLEKLQESGYSKRVPVVIITSENQQNVEVRCLSLDSIDFVRKPFHFPVILRRVRNVVNLFNYQHFLENELERRDRELAENDDIREKILRLLMRG